VETLFDHKNNQQGKVRIEHIQQMSHKKPILDESELSESKGKPCCLKKLAEILEKLINIKKIMPNRSKICYTLVSRIFTVTWVLNACLIVSLLKH
jgi:hypothetical protein